MTEPHKAPANPLNNPVTSLRGVGPALAEKLGKLSLHRVEDLLFALPIRFEDRTQLMPLGGLSPGMQAQVCGEILLCETVFRGRRSLLCRLGDGTGQITMRLFHFTNAQKDRLTRGSRLLLFGDVRLGSSGLEMVHPEYKLLGADQQPVLAKTLTPVYPTTEGVTQHRLRTLAAMALEQLSSQALPELLPAEVIEKLSLPDLRTAIVALHQPAANLSAEQLSAGTNPNIQRLALEEILAHRLSLRRLRDASQREKAPACSPHGQLAAKFLEALPFELTTAQTRVVADIENDIALARPMQRLVQGDVGSGKTVVACLAALQAIEAGFQVAFMAPTEILAEQHRLTFEAWLLPLGIKTVTLKSRLIASEKKQALVSIASGEAQMVIGTHALFQRQVQFGPLGLVVIDEQHRFGVAQRLALTEKSANADLKPHQLVMTATPIPRTLAMTAYADLDTSVIDELPPGRTPVVTVALPDTRIDELIERVHEACRSGQQAYWVCPLVEESEVLDAQAAESRFSTLTEALADIKIGLVHGRMKGPEKDAVMTRFKSGEIQLLVATTVIEVGVDVPNASLMLIENAERLGLSQLHQLRGRVGRGAAQSSCLLLYKAPLGRVAKERLRVMRETTDGFVVAEKDLELRGPGEVLGTRQTGSIHFKIADLARDHDLIPQVVRASDLLRRSAPDQAEMIIQRWLGSMERFAAV